MAIQAEKPSPSPTETPSGAREAVQATSQAEREPLKQELQNEISAAMSRFTSLVRSGKFDFPEPFNSAEEVEKNDAFCAAHAGLQKFLEETAASEAASVPELKNARMDFLKAATDFMVAEIASYAGTTWGEMGINEVEQTLSILRTHGKEGKSKQKGIGNFEKWVEAHEKYKTDYAAWHAGRERYQTQKRATAESKPEAKAELERTRIALGDTAELPGIKSRLEQIKRDIDSADTPEKVKTASAGLAALVALKGLIDAAHSKAEPLMIKSRELKDVIPASVDAEMQRLNELLRNATNETDVANYEQALTALEARFSALEPLRPYLGEAAAEIPEQTRNAIFEAVRKEQKTPEQALQELQRYKQAAQTAGAVEHESGKDAPFFDQALEWVDKMKEGRWKKALGGIVIAAATLFAALAKLPWIGEKIRGSFISNRLLAKRFNDKEAARALRVEMEFKKFGLPASLVADMGGVATKEVITAIRDPDKLKKISGDTATQQKLAHLASQLEDKGGALSDQLLVEFMDPETNTNWLGITYRPSAATVAEAPAAPAAAPTAAAPAVLPAAPAASPATPAATPAAPAPSAAPPAPTA